MMHVRTFTVWACVTLCTLQCAVTEMAAVQQTSDVVDVTMSLAASAPPEYAAYALLRIVPLADRERQLTLIDDAFNYAARGPGGAPHHNLQMEGLTAREAQATNIGIDRLSLQSRAV